MEQEGWGWTDHFLRNKVASQIRQRSDLQHLWLVDLSERPDQNECCQKEPFLGEKGFQMIGDRFEVFSE